LASIFLVQSLWIQNLLFVTKFALASIRNYSSQNNSYREKKLVEKEAEPSLSPISFLSILESTSIMLLLLLSSVVLMLSWEMVSVKPIGVWDQEILVCKGNV
jgi:hypothetical protein